MKFKTETSIVLKKITQQSGLNTEALSLIGITESKIHDAIKQCIEKGLSRKKAMDMVYKLWVKSEPDIKPITGPATAKEMALLGFYLKPTGKWKNDEYNIEIDDDFRKNVDFKVIEKLIEDAKTK